MGYSAKTFNLHISSVAIALMCVLFLRVSLAAAVSEWRNEVPVFDNLNKRDVGLKMQCQTHPRNCPGGYILKRSRLTERLLEKEPLLPTGEDDAEQRKAPTQESDDDLRRNVLNLRDELRKEMRSRLLDMLRSSPSVESSDENTGEW